MARHYFSQAIIMAMSLEAELLVCVLAQVDSSSIFLGKIIIIVAASNVSYERKAEGRRGKSLGKLPQPQFCLYFCVQLCAATHQSKIANNIWHLYHPLGLLQSYIEIQKMSRHVLKHKQGMTFLKFSSLYGFFCEYEYMNTFGNNQTKKLFWPRVQRYYCSLPDVSYSELDLMSFCIIFQI